MTKKNLFLILLLPLTAACGKPDLSALTSPTAQAASVTQVFNYDQSQAACVAIKAWDSSKTNIQYSDSPQNYAVYLFTAAKITVNGMLITQSSVNFGYGVDQYCLVLISGGKIASIQ